MQLIAKILRDTRNNALKEYKPNDGDGRWSLGCRIYERTANMISAAAEDGLLPWLTVIEPPLEFVFGVGDVPVRFYKGDADAAPGNHLKCAISEQMALGLVFKDSKVHLIWRFVVETNDAGEAETIYLLGLTNAGVVECKYEVPPDDTIVFMTPPPRTGGKPPQTQLPPAGVRSRKPPPEERKEDDDGKQPV
jgi:hypothetical protein